MNKNNIRSALFITAILLPLALLILGINPFRSRNDDNKLSFVEQSSEIVEDLQDSSTENTDSKEPQGIDSIETQIVIDIAGEVSFPGVYTLLEGSRIIDAIEAAGGLTDKSDVRFINRAEIIFDGSKIYIPAREETENGNSSISVQTAGTGRILSGSTSSSLININTAGLEELQKIPGVGPSTAEKIIGYRATYGRFETIEDLINISGIGNKTLEKMKGYITVR